MHLLFCSCGHGHGYHRGPCSRPTIQNIIRMTVLVVKMYCTVLVVKMYCTRYDFFKIVNPSLPTNHVFVTLDDVPTMLFLYWLTWPCCIEDHVVVGLIVVPSRVVSADTYSLLLCDAQMSV